MRGKTFSLVGMPLGSSGKTVAKALLVEAGVVGPASVAAVLAILAFGSSYGSRKKLWASNLLFPSRARKRPIGISMGLLIL